MKFRKITLESGTELLLGKDAKSNDELMKSFRGKNNTILHTESPGSPFCAINKESRPTNKEIELSGAACAAYSQDWRDNHNDVKVHVFTGKDIRKRFWMKTGSWNVKSHKKITIKKKDILNFERKFRKK